MEEGRQVARGEGTLCKSNMHIHAGSHAAMVFVPPREKDKREGGANELIYERGEGGGESVSPFPPYG